MMGEDLLYALNDIPEEYILEADPVAGNVKRSRTPKQVYISVLAIAAVFALAFIGGRTLLFMSGTGGSTPSLSESKEEITSPASATEEAAMDEEFEEAAEEAAEDYADSVSSETAAAEAAKAEEAAEEAAEEDGYASDTFDEAREAAYATETLTIEGRTYTYRFVEVTELETGDELVGNPSWYRVSGEEGMENLIREEDGVYTLWELVSED